MTTFENTGACHARWGRGLRPATADPVFAALFAFLSVGVVSAGPAFAQVRMAGETTAAERGALPDDGQDDAVALRKALEHARSHPGTTLRIAPGTYQFHDAAAVRLMNRAMSGDLGRNPEDVVFKPYYPYSKGLDLAGTSGLTIEARGVTILFEGWLEPVSMIDARDVTIRGLTIDYKRRAYSAGTVIAAGKDYFDADIEPAYPVNPKMPVPRASFWDKAAHRVIGETGTSGIEIIAPQRVRVHTAGAVPDGILGSAVGLMHSMHFRPAILIQQADNVRLEDVTIRSQPGMGVVAHRCSNVTMSGLRVAPAPGSYFSTNTDATHLTSCTGTIRIEHSLFEGHGDDATNIHNYYWSIERAPRKGHYRFSLPMTTHAAVLDRPDVGATLDVVRATSLEPVATATVTAVTPDPASMRVDVELAGELPQPLDQYYLADTTRLPKVEIVNSVFLSHRARGTLIKSRNVLIEGNLFQANTGTAIHVAAEQGWREGMPSSNVVIRRNRFIANGYGAGTIEGTSAIAVNIDAPEVSRTPLHHGLTIADNVIDGHAAAERCIYVSLVSDVVIRDNQMRDCRQPLVIERSEDVTTSGNTPAGRD